MVTGSRSGMRVYHGRSYAPCKTDFEDKKNRLFCSLVVLIECHFSFECPFFRGGGGSVFFTPK